MKTLFLALPLVLLASFAFADAVEHSDVAIGFHHADAPIGIRAWLNDGQSVGLDLGVGFSSKDIGSDHETDVTFDLGLPMLLHTWDQAHFLFRPGVLYHSDADLVGDKIERGDVITVAAELEAEIFITENLSVSASHGVAINFVNPADSDSEDSTEFSTFGNNVNSIGFHIYGLWD